MSEISVTIMASKTMEEQSNGLQELVIKHFLKGDTEREIAQKVMIPRKTVHSIVAKYKSSKCAANIWGPGRKRKTTAKIDRIVQSKIKGDR